MLRYLIIPLIAVAAIGCSSKSAPKTFEIAGTISASECGGGYRIENAAVTIKNEAGTIVASSATSADIIFAPTPLPAPEQAQVDQYTRGHRRRRPC